MSDERAVLHPDDRAVLDAVREGSGWLRALACTVARRGLAFRLEHPERARAVLDALAVSPLYKGGQFLFDLLEWEDFMLDGPPPPLLPTTLDARALRRVAGLLRSVQTHLDGGAEAPAPWDGPEVEGGVQDDALPPLEPGLHLYADVVLGIVRSAAPLLATSRRDGRG